MNNLQHSYYISSINSAIDYIESNIDKSLRLENIARAAGLSPLLVFLKHIFLSIFRSGVSL